MDGHKERLTYRIVSLIKYSLLALWCLGEVYIHSQLLSRYHSKIIIKIIFHKKIFKNCCFRLNLTFVLFYCIKLHNTLVNKTSFKINATNFCFKLKYNRLEINAHNYKKTTLPFSSNWCKVRTLLVCSTQLRLNKILQRFSKD